MQFTDNASTESWQTVLSSEVNTRESSETSSSACRMRTPAECKWTTRRCGVRTLALGSALNGGVNTVSQGFSPEEVIFTLSAGTHQDDLEHHSEIVSLTKVFSRMSASTVYQKADGGDFQAQKSMWALHVEFWVCRAREFCAAVQFVLCTATRPFNSLSGGELDVHSCPLRFVDVLTLWCRRLRC